MGFEFIYAYLENLAWFFRGGLIISSLALMFLFVARIANDIDKDDWILIMGGSIVIWFLFLVVCLSPSMDHIKEVRAAVTKIETVNQTNNGVKPNETILRIPIFESSNGVLCR